MLYCALEDSERRLRSRMKKIYGGDQKKWPQHLTLATKWRRIDQGGLDDIREWHRQAKAAGADPVMVAIDVLSKLRPITRHGIDAYTVDYMALSGLHALAIELNIAIVVVHHTRKMASEDLLDSVSGTYGISGCADTIMVLDRNALGTTLNVRGRDVEEVSLAVEFNKKTCRWTILGAAHRVHMSDERRAVLEALKDKDGKALILSPSQIAEKIAEERKKVDTLLAKMLRSGQVARPEPGKYTLPVEPTEPSGDVDGEPFPEPTGPSEPTGTLRRPGGSDDEAETVAAQEELQTRDPEPYGPSRDIQGVLGKAPASTTPPTAGGSGGS